MSIFIEHPALTVALGVPFLAGYWISRRPTNAVAAGAWLAYSGYEAAMRLRWLCTGECNIRVDLLLIYPILLVISLVAVVALVRWRLARSDS
jgi:hypothetical protein